MTELVREDAEHLRMLTIGHYVLAGINAFFGLLPLIHVGMGLAIVSGKMPMGPSSSSGGAGVPQAFGWMFVVIGALVIVLAQTTAVLNVLAARALATRRRRTFCVVVAALNCINAPLGTVLGVFTLIVLGRERVRQQFEASSASG
jgi:hypothetical protein